MPAVVEGVLRAAGRSACAPLRPAGGVPGVSEVRRCLQSAGRYFFWPVRVQVQVQVQMPAYPRFYAVEPGSGSMFSCSLTCEIGAVYTCEANSRCAALKNVN